VLLRASAMYYQPGPRLFHVLPYPTPKLLGSQDNLDEPGLHNKGKGTGYGIYISGSDGTVSGNTCNENFGNGGGYGYGIYFNASSNNTIYLNSFSGSYGTVASSGSTNTWSSPEQITYIYDGNAYKNYLGNFYRDYSGLDDGSGGRTAGDGIGDTAIPYPSDGSGDNYPLTEPAENYVTFIPGDADGDGDVDVFDLVNVKRIILGLDPPTPGADANVDGHVDVFDLAKIKRIILGLE